MKDLKENIDVTEIFAFAVPLIAKKSCLNNVEVVSLESCMKIVLDEEVFK